MSRINRKKLLIPAFCLCLLLCGQTAGLAQEDIIASDQMTVEEVNYNTVTVVSGTFERPVSNSLSEYYPLVYPLKFEGSNAKFIEYTVKRGDEVKAGDVLARFEITGSDAAMESMELNLRRAEEALEEGLRDREEQIRLKRAEVSEEKDSYVREKKMLEMRKMEIEMEQYRFRQEYSIAGQRKAVEEERANRAANELIAPVDGVVADVKYKKLDDAVSTNEVLITLSSTDVMLLRVDNSSGSFRYNMPVTVTVGSNKKSTDLTGRVVASDHAIDEKDQTGHALILLDPYDESIKLRNPKVKASYMLLEEELIVPRKAATLENGKYYVTKLVDGMVQKRYVQYAESNTSEVWLLQGVSEGDVLIVD